MLLSTFIVFTTFFTKSIASELSKLQLVSSTQLSYIVKIVAEVIIDIKFNIKITGDDCKDKEEYCEWGPDCNVELVKENCPKYCNECNGFKSIRTDDQHGIYIDKIVLR